MHYVPKKPAPTVLHTNAEALIAKTWI